MRRVRRLREWFVLLAGGASVACGAAGLACGDGGGARHGAAGPSAPADLVVSNRGGAWRVYELAAEGGARLVGSPRADGPAYEDRQPARLPDGTIVFTSNRSGPDALYLAATGAATARPLFSAPEETGGGADSDPAACGADRIVFARAAAAAPGAGDGDRDLYLAARDGRGVQRLTRDPADDGAPCALPDGRTIVFASVRQGTRRLYRLDSAAADPEATVALLLPPVDAADDAPACLADGSILFARTLPGAASQIFLVRFGEHGPVTRQITEAATLPYGAGEPVSAAAGSLLLTAGPGPAKGGPRYAVYGISGGGYNLARVTRERAGYEDWTRRLRPLR